jgi:hypothetical protein
MKNQQNNFFSIFYISMRNFINLIAIFISFFTFFVSITLTIDTIFNDDERNIGPRGPPGYTGPRGLSGPRGMVGYRGLRGTRGINGDKGETSNKRGLDGKPGFKGDIGENGNRGSTGKPGIIGPIGKTGKHGNNGPYGVRGVSGPPGKFGPKPYIYFSNKKLEEQITYNSRLNLDGSGFGCNPQEDRNERILQNKKIIREKMLRGINLGMKMDEDEQIFGLCFKMKLAGQ